VLRGRRARRCLLGIPGVGIPYPERRLGMAKPIEVGLVLEREDARHFHEYMKQPIVTFITVLKHTLDPRAWLPTCLRKIGCVIPCDCVLLGQPPAWAGQGSKRYCHILYLHRRCAKTDLARGAKGSKPAPVNRPCLSRPFEGELLHYLPDRRISSIILEAHQPLPIVALRGHGFP